jgi:drug/metabolite transporter (DMT)-like permease
VSVVWRYAIAATLLFAWCAATGRRLAYGAGAHLRFAGLGLLLFSLNYIATYSAQLYITSALNAVAFSTMMWMNVINARLFFGTRIEPRTWAGAVLGSAGILALFWPAVAAFSWNDVVLKGAALSLGGAFLASLGNMLSKRSQEHGLPIVQSNAWGMLYGTVITAAVAWQRGLPFVFEWRAGYVASLLYLAVFGSIVAFGAYLTLVGRIGPHRAGYAVVMFPVVAIVLSMLFEGLRPDPGQLAGIALVLAGNVLVLGLRPTGPAARAWAHRVLRDWFERKVPVSERCSGSP